MKQMLHSLLLIVAIFCPLLARAQTLTRSQRELLEEAYKENSLVRFDEFLMNWQRGLSPISQPQLTETEKTLYSIYTAFFDQKGRRSIRPFYVLQNKLQYALVDSINLPAEATEAIRDTIEDFRPLVTKPNVKILYLSAFYDSLLSRFIGQNPDGRLRDSNSLPLDERKKRIQFLENKIVVALGHWGGYWFFETGFTVDLVLIKKDLRHAKLFYSDYDFSFWVCIVQKDKEGWSVISDELEAIQ